MMDWIVVDYILDPDRHLSFYIYSHSSDYLILGYRVSKLILRDLYTESLIKKLYFQSIELIYVKI